MTHSTKMALAVALVAVPAGGTAWYVTRPAPVPVIRPQRKDLTLSVTCEGRVRVEVGYGIRSDLVGHKVRCVLVKVGDTVQADQPVIELDDRRARADVRIAQAVVRQRAAALAKAEADERGQVGAVRRMERRRKALVSIAREAKRASEAIPKDEAALAERRSLLQEARRSGDADAIRKADWYVKRAEQTLRDSRARLARSRTAEPRHFDARELDAARVRAKHSRLALKIAEERLAQTTVRSRYTGTVTLVAVKPGDAVVRDRSLVWVATYTEVVARIPERYRGDAPLRQKELWDFVWPAYARGKYGPEPVAAIPGADAIVFVPGKAGSGVRADVTGLTRDETTGEQGILLRANVPLPGLGPGSRVNVDIITARYSNVLTLPRTAVLDPMGDAAVLVIEDGRVAKRPVRLAERANIEVVVKEGLRGDEAVVRIPEGLRIGARARPTGP